MKKIWIIGWFGLLVCGIDAEIISIDGNGWDRTWFEDGTAVNGANGRVGALTSGGGGRNASLVFELPVLEEGESIAAASVIVQVTAVKNGPTFNVDLYGAGFSPKGAEPPREFYEGAFQTLENGNNGLVENFIVSGNSAGSFATTGTQSAAVGEWIQGFYDANPDYAGEMFAVFRLSPDADAGTEDVGFDVAAADNTTTNYRPVLELDVVSSAVEIDGSASDRAWFENGDEANGENERVGALTTSGGGRNASLVFELPVLTNGVSVSYANLSVSLTAVKNETLFNVDVYGVNFATNGPTPPVEYYEGVFQSLENGNVGLVDDFIVSSDSIGRYTTSGSDSTAIGAWIQSFYNDNPDYSGGMTAVFRLSPDADAGEVDLGFDIASANNATVDLRPALALFTSEGTVVIGLVTLFVDGADAVVSWQGDSAASYTLQGRTSLLTGAWSNLVEEIGGVSGGMSVTNQMNQDKRFFRIISD